MAGFLLRKFWGVSSSQKRTKPPLQKRVDDRASEQTGDFFGITRLNKITSLRKSPVTALASGGALFCKEGLFQKFQLTCFALLKPTSKLHPQPEQTT
jgi:hypothetical protein